LIIHKKNFFGDVLKTYSRRENKLFLGDRFVCTTDELYDLYVKNKGDQKFVSKQLNITRYGLRIFLMQSNIPLRTFSELNKLRWKQQKDMHDPDYIYVGRNKKLCTKQELIDLYFVEGLSTPKLALKFNMSVAAIWRAFKRYNIRTRNISESNLIVSEKSREERDEHYLYKNNSIICSREEFKNLYYDKQMSLGEVATKFGTTHGTLSLKARDAGFILRTPKEIGKIKVKKYPIPTRENNPHWKGGIIYKDGYEYYFDPENPLANSKGYNCKHRMIMANKIGRELKQGEIVHHIDFDKTNNNPENLFLYQDNPSHTTVHSQTRKIMHEFYREGLLIFENGKYVVNKKAIDKLCEVMS
jgi:predicted DNA-binding protein YlxM (UPF0122 family)